jgi:hypothetical protein
MVVVGLLTVPVLARLDSNAERIGGATAAEESPRWTRIR